VKYAWLAAQGNAYSLTEMCDVLDVGINANRDWKRGAKPDRKRRSNSPVFQVKPGPTA
jgi:hypothetical protein